jgi:hypothetical protein
MGTQLVSKSLLQILLLHSGCAVGASGQRVHANVERVGPVIGTADDCIGAGAFAARDRPAAVLGDRSSPDGGSQGRRLKQGVAHLGQRAQRTA